MDETEPESHRFKCQLAACSRYGTPVAVRVIMDCGEVPRAHCPKCGRAMLWLCKILGEGVTR